MTTRGPLAVRAGALRTRFGALAWKAPVPLAGSRIVTAESPQRANAWRAYLISQAKPTCRNLSYAAREVEGAFGLAAVTTGSLADPTSGGDSLFVPFLVDQPSSSDRLI